MATFTLEPSPDAGLAERIKAGDHDAFGIFFKRHHQKLVRYLQARNRFTDPDKIQDFAQLAFIELWERREIIRPEASIFGLLLVIANHVCMRSFSTKHLPKKRRGVVMSIDQPPTGDDGKKFRPLQIRDHRPSPEETVLRRERGRMVAKLLSLTAEYRAKYRHLPTLNNLTPKARVIAFRLQKHCTKKIITACGETSVLDSTFS